MTSKLHFGILIVLIAFSVRYFEHTVVPNQQINIEFSNTEISKTKVEDAVTNITSKLSALGAEHIQIVEGKEGSLKITYFSAADIAIVQDILSNDNGIGLTYQLDGNESENIPSDKDSRDYKLKISEIQNNSKTSGWDFNGVQVTERNQKSDRSNILKKFTSGNLFRLKDLTRKVNTEINVVNNNLPAGDYAYILPEVRAGPLS